jgi:predicted metal-dependent RNase
MITRAEGGRFISLSNMKKSGEYNANQIYCEEMERRVNGVHTSNKRYPPQIMAKRIPLKKEEWRPFVQRRQNGKMDSQEKEEKIRMTPRKIKIRVAL